MSTLAVFRSWLSFGATTTLPRFASDDGQTAIEARRERAIESLRLAKAAGVRSRAARTSAAARSGRTSSPGRSSRWSRPGSSRGRPWRAATWRGGELLDEPAAGTIAEGGPADFFLVHGDPLSDPAALWRVWRVAWTD